MELKISHINFEERKTSCFVIHVVMFQHEPLLIDFLSDTVFVSDVPLKGDIMQPGVSVKPFPVF